MRSKIIFLLLFLFTFSVLNAQSVYRPGKVIMANNDTLDVKIDDISPVNPKFRPAVQRENVIGYIMEDGRIFRKEVTREGEEHFMEVLSTGPLDLLKWRNRLYVKQDTTRYVYSLSKIKGGTAMSGTKRVRVEKKPYLGILRYLMSDCPAIQPQVDNVKLSQPSLQRLFQAHAECTGGHYIARGSDLPFFRLEILPSVAFMSNDYTMNTVEFAFANPDLESTNSFAYGISFDLNFDRLSRRFSLLAGYLYHATELTGTSNHKQEFIRYENTLSMNYTEHQLTLGIKYEIPYQPVSPYISAQAILLLPTEVESTILRSRFNTTQDLKLEEQVLENTIDMKGTNAFQLAVGIRLNVFRKLNPYIEYRMATFKDVFTLGTSSEREQRTIQAGLVWRL